MKIKAWYLALFWWFLAPIIFAAQVQHISTISYPNKAGLNIAISGSFTHKLFVLNNPYRIVIDLANTKLALNLNQLHLTTPLVTQVRSGKPNGSTLRLVIDVSQALHVRSSVWQEKGVVKGLHLELQPLNGVIHSKPTPPVVARKLPNPKPDPKPKLVQVPKPIKVSHVPTASLRDVVVVLDAGHGGKDPGAKGPHRSQEKDVVLAIALKLKRLIDKQPGMHAVLTRTGDYYVGLRKRMDIARKYNGDIFVSIHADAFNNPHSHGASVFALSQSGATSEAARWLAEKENYSELGGINLGDLDDQNGVVRSVLIDLSQTSTINSSLQMGGRVLSQLHAITVLHNNKVEQARFMVLKSPDTPSILVETGFISNPHEESNLTSQAYQMRLSQAIFQGLKSYFWESPPHGTRLEAMTSSSTAKKWG